MLFSLFPFSPNLAEALGTTRGFSRARTSSCASGWRVRRHPVPIARATLHGMELDLAKIEKQARAAEAQGKGVTRRTLKGLEVSDLEDGEAEDDAKEGTLEKALKAE